MSDKDLIENNLVEKDLLNRDLVEHKTESTSPIRLSRMHKKRFKNVLAAIELYRQRKKYRALPCPEFGYKIDFDSKTVTLHK